MRELTDEQAAEIRYRVGCGQISQRKAALEYDVSHKTIFGIMAGRLYVKPGRPPAKPEPVELPRPAIQPLRPLPAVNTSGRSYSLAPSRRSA